MKGNQFFEALAKAADLVRVKLSAAHRQARLVSHLASLNVNNLDFSNVNILILGVKNIKKTCQSAHIISQLQYVISKLQQNLFRFNK